MLHGEATADIDMKELEEISEKYGDADSRLEQIVKENAPENLQEALTNEMNDIENIEKKLEEKVENLEKGMSQEQKRMINSRFTNLWGGVRYT
jgi:predicted nuclease with TOPRIM domain